ncbi:collagen alpha-1(I) chain-like [Equus przewalskii]|uniref:Collagen alpha-1(I) chain-like n=1 Tax=Equus przewalskii TaxID=9798 RepID=A0ABM4PH00_EQUPR
MLGPPPGVRGARPGGPGPRGPRSLGAGRAPCPGPGTPSSAGGAGALRSPRPSRREAAADGRRRLRALLGAQEPEKFRPRVGCGAAAALGVQGRRWARGSRAPGLPAPAPPPRRLPAPRPRRPRAPSDRPRARHSARGLLPGAGTVTSHLPAAPGPSPFRSAPRPLGRAARASTRGADGEPSPLPGPTAFFSRSSTWSSGTTCGLTRPAAPSGRPALQEEHLPRGAELEALRGQRGLDPFLQPPAHSPLG